MIPPLEATLAGGVRLFDASALLPRRRAYPLRRRAIDRIIVHHSGALGPDGVAGAAASARFVIASKEDGGRGWPGFAYHYWLPYRQRRETIPITVLRGQPDERACYHTGRRWNQRGLGVVLQGNLGKATEWAPEGGPSSGQIEALEALLPFLAERHGLDLRQALTWHSEAGTKRSCPGERAVRWLCAYRKRV